MSEYMNQTPKQKALALQVLEYLRANPEEHDQRVVERDTKWNTVSTIRPDLIGEYGEIGCIGGWIVFFGMTKEQRQDAKWRHICWLAADLIGANRSEFASKVFLQLDEETALSNLEIWT